MSSSKKVLVLGANGHLGFNLVQVLLKRGCHVRATVRNLNDLSKTHFLKHLSGLELVQADLLERESLERAMEGRDGVFHAAAPSLAWAQDPEEKIFRPMVKGTQNVLKSAKACGVKRIIFTSSCGACGMGSKKGESLDESDWNSTARSPIVRSKVEAEKWAWQFADLHSLNLITLHPPTILGPGFHRHTLSTQIYERILRGALPPLPEGGCHLVDARDLAEAHWNAYERTEAQGRYIVAGEFLKISEFFQLLRGLNLGLKVPRFHLPGWSLQAVRAVDWLTHQVFSSPRQVTGELIHDFVGKFQHVSTQKAVRELGWSPRPAQDTILDTFNWIKEKLPTPEGLSA